MTDLVLYGPLPPDSPSRVPRTVDQALVSLVDRGQYINLVGGRQKGKTTSLLLLRKVVVERGGVSAYVDLSPLGETDRPPEEWVRLVGSAVNDSLLPGELRLPLTPAVATMTDLQSYFTSLAAGASPRRPVVLMFDEVTAVPTELRQPFFYGIRSLFNLRSYIGRPDGIDDLLFVFAGYFDPDRLMPDSANSPFNVAETLPITDFDYSLDEVRLVLALSASDYDPEAVLRLSGGHPYLTNRVASLSPAVDLDDVPDTLLANGDVNLAYVARCLRESPEMKDLLCRVAAGAPVPFVPGIDPVTADLAMIGLIKGDAHHQARISGEIYGRMLELICSTNEPQLVGPPTARDDLWFVENDGLRHHLQTLLNFADDNAAAQPTLAAVCVGAVVEGALLCVLEKRPDLQALAARLNGEIDRGRVDGGLRFGDTSRPLDRWSLAQLIEVARLAGVVTRPSSQVSHSLREWRNMIHPAEMRRSFPGGIPAELAEAAVASGHLLVLEIRQAFAGA
jgi:hypothetical protein